VTAAAAPAARPVWRVARVALFAAVLVAAGWKIYRQWQDASKADLRVEFAPSWLIAASLIVFLAYMLLIETWRRVLKGLGAHVEFGVAARIWFASNLGKYIPGKIWTVTGMMAMLKEQGVPLPVSGASAIVITIAQVATGFAVVMLTSMETMRRLAGGTVSITVATLGMALSLASAPVLTRQWNRIAVRLGREQLTVDVPFSAVIPAIVGCAISWFLYGLAFEWFCRAVLGEAAGSVQSYTAAWAASYLVGFLAIFAPGGLGAREVAMSLILPPLGLATQAQTAVITVASRLWLTIVELIPSVIAATRSVARSGKQS
jgi:uncharacterized membrane protein YbhN (UPF0104 family)